MCSPVSAAYTSDHGRSTASKWAREHRSHGRQEGSKQPGRRAQSPKYASGAQHPGNTLTPADNKLTQVGEGACMWGGF